MQPITLDVIEKCCKQAEDLFDHFLRLDSQYEDLLPKNQSRELREEYTPFSCNSQKDSEKALSSGNINSLVRARGAEGLDVKSLEIDLARKRRSLELEKRRSLNSNSSYSCSGAPLSTSSVSGVLERDSSQFRETQEVDKVFQNFPPISQHEISQDFRPLVSAHGPSDEQLHEAALTIAAVGDQIDQEYGERMNEMEATVANFIRNARGNISYDMFAVYLNELIGQDRNWTDFVCMMHLSRRVIIETKNIGKTVFQLFRRFIGEAFAEEIARETDVVEYVVHSSSSLR